MYYLIVFNNTFLFIYLLAFKQILILEQCDLPEFGTYKALFLANRNPELDLC